MLEKICLYLGILIFLCGAFIATYNIAYDNGNKDCISQVNQNNATIQHNQLEAIIALPKTQEERLKCLDTLDCHL